ncbi:MAG: AMP-binding protein [Deltaproteobacteria bacterium]|nr:AMP-binding protein [Deltaproteobacteria bacterium]
MSRWLHVGDVLRVNATMFPDKEGTGDLYRRLTFREWNERCNRLANALAAQGLKKGDRIAILAFNCLEWMEIYGACAKGGFVAVPIMFRLTPVEYTYIVNDAECAAFICEAPFVKDVDETKPDLTTIPADRYYFFGREAGPAPTGYTHLEDLFAAGDPGEPSTVVDHADTWIIMYTSGTTGRPKGVVRTHESLIAQYLTNISALEFSAADRGLSVMPMCHINSVYYSFVFTYVRGAALVYNSTSFDPEHMLKTLSEMRVTFTSLVPTHYIMMLSLPEEVKAKHNVDCVKKLMISSAPARRDTKLAIMDHFKNSQLYEAYGSTEAGLVTLLQPSEQFDKLGSIGREIIGTDLIKLLDPDGVEVPVGEVGELYSRTPMVFSEYWKQPELTKQAFVGEHFSAGDMAYKDEEGYYYLVDRKKNMIITGGENVYPSEVEDCVGGHTAVKDVAVIGVPDEKWGERVVAVVILHKDFQASPELAKEITEFTKSKIAGFKRPKDILFIAEEEMPRTGTGKILHRKLRERFGHWADNKN